jgi:hypothetical protein
MRNNALNPIRTSLLAFVLLMLGTTSCIKENINPEAMTMSEEMMQTLRTSIVGNWQLEGKGYALAPRREQILNDVPALGDAPALVKWETVANGDKRRFKADGNYSENLPAAETCQGTYTIANTCALTIKSNCDNPVEAIQELTTNGLVVKVGVMYYKYHKLD